MQDATTTIAQLRDQVKTFVDERDWQQFHSSKNLSMALAIEAAELMEHFQWISADESRNLDQDKRVAVGEELADVFCYTLAIANELDIDLAQTFERKMGLNKAKYPADEYRGRYGADDPGPTTAPHSD